MEASYTNPKILDHIEKTNNNYTELNNTLSQFQT